MRPPLHISLLLLLAVARALPSMAQAIPNRPRDHVPNFALPSGDERLPLVKEPKSYATEQWRLGNYGTALNYFAQAYKEDVAAGDIAGMAGDLNSIGLVQWRLNDCASAMESYTASAWLAASSGERRLLGLTCLNRSILLKNQDDTGEAFRLNHKAITIFTELGAKQDLALALNNEGQVHKHLGGLDSATVYYRRSLELCKLIGDTLGKATAWYNLSDIAARKGHVKEAFSAGWRALNLARAVRDKVRISETLLLLSGLHERLGGADSALVYFKVYSAYQDSLNAANRSEALAVQQARLGAEVKDLRILNLQNERSLQQARTWGIAAVVLVMMLIGAFIAQRRLVAMRNRKRLLELELVNANTVLAVQERELKHHILAIAEKTVEVQHLQAELAERPAYAFAHEVEVAELLERKILTDDDWSGFKQKFASIYPHFFARLKLLGVSLTEGEVRFMVLQRLGLAPKEMAEVLGISPQSARVGKLRLKKKLVSEGMGSLEDFLERLIA
jgi:tetratricopeptide (TPR) repeat protein